MIFFYYPFDENAEMKVFLKKGGFLVGVYSHYEVLTIDEKVITLHYYKLNDQHIAYQIDKNRIIQKSLVAVNEKDVKAVELFKEAGGEPFSDLKKLQKQTFWPYDLGKRINQAGLKKMLAKIEEQAPTKLELKASIIGGYLKAVELIYAKAPDLFQMEDEYAETFYDWLMIAVDHNRLDIIQWFFDHPKIAQRKENKKAEILKHACKRANLEILEFLLDQGYDINKGYLYTDYSYDPMAELMKRTALDVVEMIKARGTLALSPKRFGSLIGRMRNEVLFDSMMDFIPAEEEQAYLNEGLTGAAFGYFGLIEKFLEKGAEIDYMDEKGMTPICYALSAFNDTCLSRLIKHGANRELGKINGQSPKEFAASLDSLPKFAEILNT